MQPRDRASRPVHRLSRSTGESVDVLPNGPGDTENPQSAGPGAQRDDAADLVVDDRAEAGADRAPQSRAGQPAEREQQNVAAAEHDGDATPVENRIPDRPADRLAEDPECDSGQCAGDDLGGQDA